MSAYDNAFGPGFADQFDFTIVFENSFMAIVPAVVLLAGSPVYIAHYWRKDAVADRGLLYWVKQVLGLSLFCIELARSVILCRLDYIQEQSLLSSTSTASSVLATLSTVAIMLTLHWEYFYAFRSASFVSLSLALSVLGESARARTFYRRSGTGLAQVGDLTIALIVAKLVLIVVEEIPKKWKESVSQADKYTLESRSGVLDRIWMYWINSILVRGFRTTITMQDILKIGPEFRSKDLTARFDRVWAKTDKTAKRALLYACAKVVWRPFVAALVPRIMYTGSFFSYPFILQAALSYLGDPNPPGYSGGGIIGATAFGYCGFAITMSAYEYLTVRTGTMTQGILVSQILKKNLRLPLDQTKDAAAFTLITADIENILVAIDSLHDFWISFLELGLGLYMMWTQIGPAFFLPFLPIVVIIYVFFQIGKAQGPATRAWNKSIEVRVGQTSGLLAQIKGIKMTGLEKTITEFIQGLRSDEMAISRWSLRLSSYQVACRMSLTWIPGVFMMVGGIYWTVWRDHADPTSVFTAMSMLYLLHDPTQQICRFWSHFAAMLACFDRIQTFLNREERVDHRKLLTASTTEKAEGEAETPALSMDNVSVSGRDGQTSILKNIDLSVPKGSLTMIAGPVGSGKTVLLKTLLGETVIASGTVSIATDNFAYCDQHPWLPDIPLKDVIIEGAEFDKGRYEAAVKACELLHDISQLSKGDQTRVGLNGSNLSGGQKQRLALARAVYALTPVVICDDALSALDGVTAKAVFDNVFGPSGLLRRDGRTAVLATHAVEFLRDADQLIELDASHNIITHTDKGAIHEFIERTKARYIRQPTQDDASNSQVTDILNELHIEAEQMHQIRPTSDFSLYKYLFQGIPWWITTAWLVGITVAGISNDFLTIYLNIWVGLTNPNNALIVAGGAIMSVFTIIIAIMVSWLYLVYMSPRMAERMHKIFLTAVTSASLPFITTTSSGLFINRFSQDMAILAKELPTNLLNVARKTVEIGFLLGVIAAGSIYAIAFIPVSIIYLWILQWFYLRTSRQMRILELEAKTPMFTKIGESLSGVEHIRSYGWEHRFIENSFSLVDYSQKAYYYFRSIQRWLLLVLDLAGAAVAIILVALAVNFRAQTNQAGLGLALVNVVTYGPAMRHWLMFWTKVENALGVIARLRLFVENTPVEKDVDGDAPPSWPTKGEVEFRDVTAKYGADSTTEALKHVSLKIRHGQKAVIAGRTGSGKSSFVLTVLNFLNLSGSVLIDGVDISEIPRHTLRHKITTIPQEALLLPGSIRRNLMPFELMHDDGNADKELDSRLEQALDDVGLLAQVQKKGGLGTDINDVHFSAGQRQLFNIARALIHHEDHATKIILMDEVTSSMDHETDRKLQDRMNADFKDSTVIVVSHRASGFENSDIVIRLRDGVLLKSEESDDESTEAKTSEKEIMGSSSKSESEK